MVEADNFSDYPHKYRANISHFHQMLKFEMCAGFPYTPHMYVQYTTKPKEQHCHLYHYTKTEAGVAQLV